MSKSRSFILIQQKIIKKLRCKCFRKKVDKVQEWTLQQWEQNLSDHRIAAFYLYTPMCGTCAVASKMLEVVENVLPDVPIGKANINFLQPLAMEYKIESVPCLLISKCGKIVEKLYAFQSVPNLYELLRK